MLIILARLTPKKLSIFAFQQTAEKVSPPGMAVTVHPPSRAGTDSELGCLIKTADPSRRQRGELQTMFVIRIDAVVIKDGNDVTQRQLIDALLTIPWTMKDKRDQRERLTKAKRDTRFHLCPFCFAALRFGFFPMPKFNPIKPPDFFSPEPLPSSTSRSTRTCSFFFYLKAIRGAPDDLANHDERQHVPAIHPFGAPVNDLFGRVENGRQASYESLGPSMQVEDRVRAFGGWLYKQKSPNGRTALQTVHRVLYGGAESEIPHRIFDASFDLEMKVPRLSLSSLGEIAGWVRPNFSPPRNNRTNKALRALGYDVKVYGES